MKPSTRQCDECLHFHDIKRQIGVMPSLVGCDKLHRPRFYKPRNSLNDNYGWKRKCGDFDPRAPITKGAQ